MVGNTWVGGGTNDNMVIAIRCNRRGSGGLDNSLNRIVAPIAIATTRQCYGVRLNINHILIVYGKELRGLLRFNIFL